jgi:hypothetical protein
MTIRRKLLVLLVVMTIPPLVAISVYHQVSIRLARRRLTARLEQSLDASSRRGSLDILDNYDEIFQRESRLMGALIWRQAREVEIRLSQEPSPDAQ